MIRRRIKNRIKKMLGREVQEASRPVQASTPRPAAKPAPKPEPKPEPVAAKPEPVAAKPEPVVEPVAAAPQGAQEPAPAEVSEPEPAEASTSTMDPDDDTAGAPLTMDAVQEILDDMVRPALQADGGDISLLKVEDNDIYVKLVGSCSTCPSSIMTMKMGVERLLMEEFPAMGQLIQVD